MVLGVPISKRITISFPMNKRLSKFGKKAKANKLIGNFDNLAKLNNSSSLSLVPQRCALTLNNLFTLIIHSWQEDLFAYMAERHMQN